MKFTHYVITGTTVQGKRFRMQTSNAMHADCINLYNGSVWGVKTDGKRKLLKRVSN